MPPVTRGYITAAIDWFYGWRGGLDAGSCTYSVESLKIPIQDDIIIAADLYQPIGAAPAGTLFVRSPYGITFPRSITLARLFAARGYQVLVSCCRGTFESTGELDPGRYEAADGAALVAWMREQDWYTGSFATLGASYVGYVQWALLAAENPPSDMKVAAIHTGPHDFGEFTWSTGALRSDIISWADLQVAFKRTDSMFALLKILKTVYQRLAPAFDSVPLLEAVDKHFEGETPGWLRNTVSKPNLKDEYWTALRQTNALDNTNIPVLLSTGWDDLILPSVMDQYAYLQARGCNVALTIGPWTHMEVSSVINVPLTLDWLDEHYSKRKPGLRKAPVRVFITGAQEWRDLPKWPPPTSPQTHLLSVGGKLIKDGLENDNKSESSSSFEFDPKNPTPSIGAPMLFDISGMRQVDDSALRSRSDVLVFTTEPLENDVDICGRPSVELYHSTSHPHADLLVLLSEIDSAGKSKSITDYFLRLDSDRDQKKPLSLDLYDCGHRLRKGSKIQLLIAGSSHPRFIRNTGTGDITASGTELKSVVHTIQHNVTAVSKLILPATSSD